MSIVFVPESWEDEAIVVSNKVKNKKPKKYPEMISLCPKLRNILLKCEIPGDVQHVLDIYLEAVSGWKPKYSSVGKREVANKKKEDQEYKVIYNAWLVLIQNVGLLENSSLIERQSIQHILEKYAGKKYEPVKFQIIPNNYSGGFIGYF
jgi:hypothetical protein